MGGDQSDRPGIEDAGSEGITDSDRFWQDQAGVQFSDATSCGARQEIIGGILRQLRNLQASHLAYVRAHESRLQARLEESRKHQETIAQEMKALEEVITQLLAFEENKTQS
ncbi:MAG TPA: hypothetical protein DCE56_05055 [Cyanobacteria bacterium UBA8553]|nr:hypothetical protein [Cyanobacteria bacterium UBA8553]